MNADDLHPEIRKTVSRTPRIPFEHRWLLPLSKFLYNVGAATNLPSDVTVSSEAINDVDVRIYEPRTRAMPGAILWMFGGGHWAGKPDHLNAIAGLAANNLGVPVFVPNYRLAPDHPFPANLNDCHAVWSGLIQNTKRLEIDIDWVALAGNSAGGGLAAALAQRLRDEGGPQPIAQCLFYPMLDDRTAADRSLDRINHFVWNNKANYQAWRSYLYPDFPGARDLPNYAAPGRRNDLTGLPRHG